MSLRVIETPRPRIAPVMWLGGKSKHVHRILELLSLAPPDADTYCEPYGGALNVYWALPKPYRREIINDANPALMTMYRVLQSRELFPRLWRRLLKTPYAAAVVPEANAILALTPNAPPIDTAWAMLTLYNCGFGGQRPTTKGTWGRTFKPAYGIANTVNTRLLKLRALPAIHYRIQNAQIHCADALDIIREYDSPTTVFYLDPPYHPDTRKSGEYDVETNEHHHTLLLEQLLRIKGYVVLSGYPHEDYQALETAGWQRWVFQTSCHAAVRARGSRMRGIGAATAHAPRWECLWVKNP